MNSVNRRSDIIRLIKTANKPLKGTELANIYNVTRQIIVKDIALLRAQGYKIIATPDGYIYGNDANRIKFVIAVNHGEDRLFEELNIVIKYGGIIEDVIVEHPIYGEIRAMLMIKNLNDLENFINKYKDKDAKPLSTLTNGIHIHTISSDNEINMNLIKEELNKKGFMVKDN